MQKLNKFIYENAFFVLAWRRVVAFFGLSGKFDGALFQIEKGAQIRQFDDFQDAHQG